jgi:CRISPR type IV-associated protein Csf3
MMPVHVTAHLGGPLRLPHGWISLDALLGAAICMRDGITPSMQGEGLIDLAPEIGKVLARSECGRLWLASWSVGEPESYERRWTNRRPPIAEAQAMGNAKVKTISVGGGHMKAMHKPAEAIHFRHDRLDWYAMGDVAEIEGLLELIVSLGAKRNAGDGAVRRWQVRECAPWAPGFPCVLDGQPLRPLPLDWPGVDQSKIALDFMALSPPYWPHDPRAKVDVFVPVRQ